MATDSRAADIGPQGGRARAERFEEIRNRVAEFESRVGIPHHRDNRDETRYANKIGNYSKGLKHDPLTGEVDSTAYQALAGAISTGRFSDFEDLATNGHLGCADPTRQRRLVNPQAGYAFDLGGTDSHQLFLPPAPARAQEAGERVKLYWMALLRDVNFGDHGSSSMAQAAAYDLTNLSDFRGPRIGRSVTPQTLFRDNSVFSGAQDRQNSLAHRWDRVQQARRRSDDQPSQRYEAHPTTSHLTVSPLPSSTEPPLPSDDS